jgi:hypothetical protein
MIGVIRWAFRMTQTVMVVLFWNGGSSTEVPFVIQKK